MVKRTCSINSGFSWHTKYKYQTNLIMPINISIPVPYARLEIARAVRNYVEAHEHLMPQGIELALWGDLSRMVQDRISLLSMNGIQGILLVFLSLALFLNFRLAFWVAIGIPISFRAAFFVLDWHGDTINLISLFAFIMTLGILADDAIIFGENAYSHSYQRC